MFLLPAVSFALALFSAPAWGQSANQAFTIEVPQNLNLRPLAGPQTVTHPKTSADITFADNRWIAISNWRSGATVQFLTITPFRIVGKPQYARDVRLTLRPLMGLGSWTRDVITSQTDYLAGDNTSQVQLHCNRAGLAIIGLDVTFLTGNPATLVGGNYEVTVIGTISAN
ncbi:MAG: hypothetical protein R3C49_25735 [Planctomycetaceae bacterium]